MKLKYIIATLFAGAALLTACQKEADQHYLDEVKVSTSYVSLPVDGGTANLTITATDSWAFAKAVNIGTEKAPVMAELPTWLTASTLSGAAGEVTVTFSAEKTLDGRTTELQINCGGKTQRINVIQGLATVSNATCAEVIAGPDSKNYRVTGVVTRIANTTYGNWYLQDATGEIYIYGTLDAKGAAKNFLSWGLEVGDEITVEGPKTTYNGTVELVDVTVVNISKSLIKVETVDPEDAVLPAEGGAMTVTLANKGNNIGLTIPEDAKSWLGVSSISDNVVVLTAAANEGGDRETTVTFTTSDGKKNYTAELAISQKGAIIDASVADFLAAPVSSTIYRVTGVITSVANPTYGNVNIKDFSGETYVYGIGAKGDFEKLGLKLGDIVTLLGNRGEYKGSAQMTGGKLEKSTPVTEADIPTILAAEDGGYYRVTGTVKEIVNDTYGNIYISDGTNDLYVYGCYPGVGASGDARKGVVAAEGIEVGDILTVFGPKSTYKGTPQINGGFFWSLEKGGSDEPGGDEPGGDEPGELGPFDTNVAHVLGTSSYDDGVINVTLGENSYENVFSLKFGTSKKYGDATITLPAGTKKVTYYAVAWKGNPATLKFSVGENVIGTQDVAANDGATSNSPYTITVTDSDKYEMAFETALAADTTVKVETCEGTNTGFRALLFGIQAAK